VLKLARLPLRLTSFVVAAYGQEPDATAFGISQAVTRAAQTLSPEERLRAEIGASRYVQQAVSEARQADRVR
jgi:hypothetical protein